MKQQGGQIQRQIGCAKARRRSAGARDRERKSVEGGEKNQQSKNKKERGAYFPNSQDERVGPTKSARRRTKQGRGDLLRRSATEDGIQSETQFHSVLALLHPPRSRHPVTCSGSVQLHVGPGHVLFSRLPPFRQPFSTPPQPAASSFRLMDVVTLCKGVAPNLRPPKCRCGGPAEGFRPLCSGARELLGKRTDFCGRC